MGEAAKRIPQHVREQLGLPKRGPLPRGLRLASTVVKADDHLITIVPDLIKSIEEIALDRSLRPGTRLQAAVYLLNRVMGAPTTEEVAGKDDMRPPVDGVDPYVAQVMTAFEGLTDSARDAIRQTLVADLVRQGKVPADTDPADISVDLAAAAERARAADASSSAGDAKPPTATPPTDSPTT